MFRHFSTERRRKLEMSNGTGYFDYHKTNHGRRLGAERLPS